MQSSLRARQRALEALCLALTTSATFGLTACGISTQPHETSQLVENAFACDVDQARADELSQLYGNRLVGGSTEHRATATQALSLIPTEYLRFVFDRNQVPVELRETGGSVRGMTTSQGNGEEWYPIEIWVAPKTGNFDPLPHELGHATEHYVNKTFPEFEQQLEATYQASALGTEGTYMRSYARSNSTEYFAELFDSYYCGEASRAHMRDKMPQSYALAQKYFIAPDAKANGTTGEDSPRGAELDVDKDKDGVPDAYDRCRATPSGRTVAFSRAKSGCAEGEAPTP